MNILYNRCMEHLKNGTYKEIPGLVSNYDMAVDDDKADENDYKNAFHLVLENALENNDRLSQKDKNFSTWICQTILAYYSRHVPINETTRNRFNAFINGNYIPEDLTESVLLALYSNTFESLEQIFKKYTEVDFIEPPMTNPLEAITHIQMYAVRIKGVEQIKLLDILENKLLKFIPDDDRDSYTYEKLIEAIDNITLSPPIQAPKKSYRNRLMLGEANYGYTTSLLRKHVAAHPKLAQSIVSTEYLDNDTLLKVYGNGIKENIAFINSLGGKVYSGFDAQQINTYQLPHPRYHRIHFNFPHDKSEFKARTLPLLLKNFFQAAKHIQLIHDRIHMALPIEKIDFYHGYVYDIYEASARAGYQLVKKRRFDNVRYPGYKHSITATNSSAAVAEKGASEFIFEKTNYSYEDLLIQSPPRKIWISYDSKTYNFPPHLNTDNESSDYLTDEETPKPSGLRNS